MEPRPRPGLRRLVAPLLHACARARHSRARWLWPAFGLAVTVAAAGALAAEATIAGDQAARAALAGMSPAARAVRITWQGPVSAATAGEASGVLAQLHAQPVTGVVLLEPVRLSGVIVRPVAIAPLRPWIATASRRLPGSCRAHDCPMLLAGGARTPLVLRAAGVELRIAGRARLDSAVPLGFATAGDGSWPLVMTSDLAGLEGLDGLSGIYRTRSWVAPLPTAHVYSWDLGALERRLQRAQASLLDFSQQFAFSAPFAGIDAARAAARAAPTRLALVGGAAVVVVALFVLIGAAGLAPERGAELERLRLAGATASQAGLFVVAEAVLLGGAGLLAGAAAAIVIAAVLAGLAGEPATGVLAHSLLTPTAALALAAGWLIATAVLAAASLPWHRRALDLAGFAGGLALVAALTLGSSGATAWSAVLTPLWCLAGGLVVFRAAGPLLRLAERSVRAGPVTLRLAVVSLARGDGLPAFTVAFVAIAVALGGFALSYRATLARGAADQAAAQVPLDALLAPGASFETPLEAAPAVRWRSLAGGGAVLPVRRTFATYASGYGSVTEPALGVPASGLRLIRGWRRTDAAAPLAQLGRRLRPPGPLRTPGPELAAGTRELSLEAYSPQVAVDVFADLRDPGGDVQHLALGSPGARPRRLVAHLPRGAWELEAIEVDEAAGIQATNGHQNAENPAASTQDVVSLRLGSLRWTGGVRPGGISLADWVGVGALSEAKALAGGGASLRFDASGFPGVLRPPQPSDTRPVPVLVDPATAAAAGPGGRLALMVDELPLKARVVGVLRRFPTIAPTDAGFVVADEAVLGAALDAQLPGQGAADELWIDAARVGRLRVALRDPRFASLSVRFRADVEHGLASAPVSRAVSRVLLGAAALAALLAVGGLMLVGLGPLRDRRVEADLLAQGFGPTAARRELLARLAAAALLGAIPGVALAALLAAMSVTGLGRAAAGAATIWPSLVPVVPVGALAGWTAAVVGLPVLGGWAAAVLPSRRS